MESSSFWLKEEKGGWLITPPIGNGRGGQLLQWLFWTQKWDDWHLGSEKQTFISLALSKNMDWGFKFISKAAWWLVATLGEPFSRFIRNFWVEVRCDWLSGIAAGVDSVSKREDFFALMNFRGLFIILPKKINFQLIISLRIGALLFIFQGKCFGDLLDVVDI